MKKRSSWYGPRLGALFCGLLCVAGPSAASDYEVAPTLAVSEEYNDNVLDEAAGKKSDFITRLQPGVAARYRSPSLTGDLGYSFDYHHYARRVKQDEENHYLALKGGAELVENLLFLEVSDTLSRISLDVARDRAAESLHANQTDRNKASVSPYLRWRLGSDGALKTGYRFTDTGYRGSSGIDRREHQGFAELAAKAGGRLGVSAGYSVSDVDTDLVSYRQHDLRGGFRYEYLQKSFLFAEVGNSWQRFSGGESASNAFWQAGVSKSFDGVEATVETLVQYVDDPLAVSTKQTSHRASLAADLPRGGFGLSSTYVKYLDTLTGGNGRKKGEIRGFWRFLASPRLQTLLSLTGDRVSRRTPDDYPYHVSATAGADYLLNHGVTASVSVSYIDYRHNWDSSAGARRTNRVILGVKKLF